MLSLPYESAVSIPNPQTTRNAAAAAPRLPKTFHFYGLYFHHVGRKVLRWEAMKQQYLSCEEATEDNEKDVACTPGVQVSSDIFSSAQDKSLVLVSFPSLI